MALPAAFLAYLQIRGYNSRNSAHSRAICESIVADLMAWCPKIRDEALADRLVFKIDHVLPAAGLDEWKTDLAIGPPAPGFARTPGTPPGAMPESTPISTRVAVEAKSTMTKHSAAKKNRKRDLEAHHQHVHAYNEATIAASISLVNAADVFHSSLRTEPTIITTRAMSAYAQAEGVVDQVRMIAFSPPCGRSGDGRQVRTRRRHGQHRPGLDQVRGQGTAGSSTRRSSALGLVHPPHLRAVHRRF